MTGGDVDEIATRSSDNMTRPQTLVDSPASLFKESAPPKRDVRFWIVFFAIGISTAVPALELVSGYFVPDLLVTERYPVCGIHRTTHNRP